MVDIKHKELEESDTICIDGIEFQKVKYGRWRTTLTGWIYCSVCGSKPPYETNMGTPYCPHCGARMDTKREAKEMEEVARRDIAYGEYLND